MVLRGVSSHPLAWRANVWASRKSLGTVWGFCGLLILWEASHPHLRMFLGVAVTAKGNDTGKKWLSDWGPVDPSVSGRGDKIPRPKDIESVLTT